MWQLKVIVFLTPEEAFNEQWNWAVPLRSNTTKSFKDFRTTIKVIIIYAFHDRQPNDITHMVTLVVV